MRENLIYSLQKSGHRQAYLNQLGPMFGLTPVTGRMTRSIFRRMLRAEQLLIADIDEDVFSFAACAVARSILRRPTVALFLRAQKCFEAGRWYYPAKRYAFRLIRRIPGLTVATITPFHIAPRYAEVATIGVCDPQYWDMHDGASLRGPRISQLSEDVCRQAEGRAVLCVLGWLGTAKGLEFLLETLEANPEITKKVFVVCVGRVVGAPQNFAERLVKLRAALVDRFVPDNELESLYGVAHAVWSCYAPGYDQASGIFGRAIQFNVPPVVREGSILSKFAEAWKIQSFPVVFGDRVALARVLLDVSKLESPQGNANRSIPVGKWREDFEKMISAGLTGKVSHAGPSDSSVPILSGDGSAQEYDRP